MNNLALGLALGQTMSSTVACGEAGTTPTWVIVLIFVIPPAVALFLIWLIRRAKG